LSFEGIIIKKGFVKRIIFNKTYDKIYKIVVSNHPPYLRVVMLCRPIILTKTMFWFLKVLNLALNKTPHEYLICFKIFNSM
jgi:hypothetical protein